MSKVLSLKTINPRIFKLKNPLRGPIAIKAVKLEEELKTKSSKLPFNEVIRCNIEDSHAHGQQPITFFRQVIAGITLPSLTREPWFPSDAKQRVDQILAACPGNNIGSYSASLGNPLLRKEMAKYISKRDNINCNFDDVFLTSGSSDAIKLLFSLFSTGQSADVKAGVMIPIPQDPLYPETMDIYNAYPINYYLDESNYWGISEMELRKSLDEAKGKCIPRAIVVINPGNPTGQVLSKDDIKMIIRFAFENKLVILADEVYQFNIYHPDKYPWYSFRSVLLEMEPEIRDNVELASFMSASKGYMGECGFRGGSGNVINFDEDVRAQLYKYISGSLFPSTSGDALMVLISNPPQPNEPSYESFTREKNQILTDLKQKAGLVYETLNSLDGISCNPIQGAMYAFPSIRMPEKAIEEARRLSVEPDFLYCSQLLENTGICVVPGSELGQMPGTFHFRISLLPTVDKMKAVMKMFQVFHSNFLEKYS